MAFAGDAEGDLSLDDPQALVVVMRVRLVVGARVVTPAEDLEAFVSEAARQGAFARLRRLGPAQHLELHAGRSRLRVCAFRQRSATNDHRDWRTATTGFGLR